MTIDELKKEFTKWLSKETGEPEHLVMLMQSVYIDPEKLWKFYSQAEARGRESVVEMIEGMKVKVNEVVDMDITADYFDRGYNTALLDLLTKLKEERGRTTT